MRKAAFWIFVVLVCTACSRASAGPQVQIETSAGKEFKVVIPSNPSTGYHWEVVGELDSKIVQFVSRDYRADQPVQPGSGGSDIFIFKGVGSGETTITLGYYPPGDSATQPQQTKTFNVVVK